MGKAVVPSREVVWKDHTYTVPVLSRGRKLNKTQKRKVAELVCAVYASDEVSLSEALKLAGVKSESTWWLWTRDVEEIEAAYREAHQQRARSYSHRLRAKALMMTEKLITGYKLTATDKKVERVVVPAGEGEIVKEEKTTIITKTTFVKPSVRLIETVLYNNDPDHFERNPQWVESVDDAVDIPPIDWVD